MPAHLPPESPADHIRNALAILVSANILNPQLNPSTAAYMIEDLGRVRELLALAVDLIEEAARTGPELCPRCQQDLDEDHDPDEHEPPPPPDYGPPGSGAVIVEYTGNEPGLEDPEL